MLLLLMANQLVGNTLMRDPFGTCSNSFRQLGLDPPCVDIRVLSAV